MRVLLSRRVGSLAGWLALCASPKPCSKHIAFSLMIFVFALVIIIVSTIWSAWMMLQEGLLCRCHWRHQKQSGSLFLLCCAVLCCVDRQANWAATHSFALVPVRILVRNLVRILVRIFQFEFSSSDSSSNSNSKHAKPSDKKNQRHVNYPEVSTSVATFV